ncbi:hypothetical protein OS493_015154 [Desmophyllum pertusum]|uniref:SCP domain-containing protein n=1 Tax=Desmophyllum pertusum TaxID=174260 RepID=A0A9X0D367_9CNID|nr:hypothetical protein OS493_015154 [Desmophyllum pertusum]
MKACLVFCFVCLIFFGFATANKEAHHHQPVKHHSTSHKNHISDQKDQKASPGEPGALKNIILPKPQGNASLVSTSFNKSANQVGPGTKESKEGKQGAGQATGRAILVHNTNDGVGHIVQDSPSGKAPVIVINSDATGSNGGSLDPFSQDCLDAHNNYRAKHGVPPLMWSHDLAEGAQSWADQLASTDSLQHDEVAIQNRKMGKMKNN